MTSTRTNARKWRALRNRLFTWSAALGIFGATTILLGIVAYIAIRGAGAHGLSFLVSASGGELGSGGIRYQLIGSTLLIVGTLVLAAPLATASALFAAVYARPAARKGVRVLLLALNGVPSIVLGILGLTFFDQLLGWGKSWLAGSCVLALMILPTVTLALIERIDALPRKYAESAAALGLSRDQVVRSVVLPQSWTGLASGLFLGLARAFGETAPILFTAVVFSGVTLPNGIKDSPVLALPYHIFVLAQDSYDLAAAVQLWAAAGVLLGLVTVLLLLSLGVRTLVKVEAQHG